MKIVNWPKTDAMAEIVMWSKGEGRLWVKSVPPKFKAAIYVFVEFQKKSRAIFVLLDACMLLTFLKTGMK